ncbi:hypothetical protein M885DRAFT_508335 [Pelagophyceae sp. CCMP2097]|nr:hypothetical protein M885DRAFT_508335 [Pelagophyceae sp. CCMP2097]
MLMVLSLLLFLPATALRMPVATDSFRRGVGREAAREPQIGRRGAVGFGVSAWVATVGSNADAKTAPFPNAIPEAAKYADRPKRRGPMPTDLGLRDRAVSDDEAPDLKPCGAAPNCFCTTLDDADGGEHLLPRWAAPAALGREAAWKSALAALEGYVPGQGGIDGGGFGLAEARDYYALAQFQSLKNGYVDDVEFSLTEAPFQLRVRSASRVGFLDFGVNAKRLNFIAAALRKQGWDAPEITAKTHSSYFAQNAAR